MELVSGNTTVQNAESKSQPRMDLNLITTLNVKKTIKAWTQNETSWFHMSSGVIDALNEIAHAALLKAIQHAKAEGRKTVMYKDFE